MTRELKGWHVGMIFVVAFGVIISVNLVLAFKAVATFPGLEVKNSYVASQSFDAKRLSQKALGWHVDVRYASGALSVAFTDQDGQVIAPEKMQVVITRPTHMREDKPLDLVHAGGMYETPVDLAKGAWILHVSAVAENGTLFRQRLSLSVD